MEKVSVLELGGASVHTKKSGISSYYHSYNDLYSVPTYTY